MSTDKIADLLERNKYSKTTLMVEFLTDKSSSEVSKSYKRPPPLGEGLEKRKKTGAKGTVIISCADPRITPEHFLGLNFGGEFLQVQFDKRESMLISGRSGNYSQWRGQDRGCTALHSRP
jgi:hypothetical protein